MTYTAYFAVRYRVRYAFDALFELNADTLRANAVFNTINPNTVF